MRRCSGVRRRILGTLSSMCERPARGWLQDRVEREAGCFEQAGQRLPRGAGRSAFYPRDDGLRGARAARQSALREAGAEAGVAEELRRTWECHAQ